MRQKYHKNLQTLASANHPSLSDRLVQHANEGKIPYIKQGRLYAKIDPNTPDRFPNTINIGVVGDGGTGKGSLINALRRLRARDTGAAEVGVTGSNQVDTNRYPLTSTHCLCELPAFNAMYGPTAAFAERTKLSKYDAIIVTLSDSPTKNTLKLVKMANDSDIPVYFVRTKADEDIRNQREDYRRKADQVIRDINEDMSRALERENLSVQSKHFVSSRTGYQGEVKPALDALIAALNIQTKRN